MNKRKYSPSPEMEAIEKLMATRDELRQQRDELLAALKEIEFNEYSGVCNWCGGEKYTGHAEDCIVKQAIANAESE